MGCGTHLKWGASFNFLRTLEMKKFAMSAIAVAAVLGAGAANAYTSGTFTNGFVVPNVIKNDTTGATTAVGIINKTGTPGQVTSVYWTFFDQDSKHITDGCFPMTYNDYEPFVWNTTNSGALMDGKRGYLVFAAGNSVGSAAAACANTETQPNASGLLSAQAFYVEPANKDVAYTPVIDGNLTLTGATTLRHMGPDSLKVVAGAAQIKTNAKFSMRYYVDGAKGGNDTNIVVWSTGDQTGSHTVLMYDDKQGVKSVNFDLTRKELDWFDVETISGRPANFTDGFIDWDASVKPADAPTTGALASSGGSVFTYSLISAPAFGALQTILGAHTK